MKAIIVQGDVREKIATLDDNTIQTCITSPPYWGLRDYGNDGQIGLEQTPEEYVTEMIAVFREVRRVLANDGVLWLNLGDSYATANCGLRQKELVGIPWRIAFALQADGWYLRQDIIWHKPNPMPESVTDRCTKAHEYLFMLTKSARYYFDNQAIAEPLAESSKQRLSQDIHNQRGSDRVPGKTNGPMKAVVSGIRFGGSKYGDSDDPKHQTKSGNEWVPTENGTRNKRSVWTISSKPFKAAHFAVMPEALVEPCVLAASRPGDLVLDPFTGAGTTAVVALRHGRNFIGTELNPEYINIAADRIHNDQPLVNEIEIK